MVPLRFLSEGLGEEIIWKPDSNTIEIMNNVNPKEKFPNASTEYKERFSLAKRFDSDEKNEFMGQISQRKLLKLSLPKTIYKPRGTHVELTFDSSYPIEHRQYIKDLFDTVYPIIVAFTGEPYNNREMKVYYKPELGKSTLNGPMYELYLHELPLSSDGNDPNFDTMFIVELYHQFISGNEIPISRSYEYYSWAVAKLVGEYLSSNGLRDMTTVPVGFEQISIQEGLDAYEDRLILGPETYVGNGSGRIYNNFFVDQISSMFLKLLFTQSSSSDNLDFFIKLNEVLFKNTDMNRNNPFLDALSEVCARQINGKEAVDWFKEQPYKKPQDINLNLKYVFKLLPTKGTLFYPNLSDNPKRIYLFLFERDSYSCIPISDADIRIQVYDQQNRLVYEETTKSIDKTDFMYFPVHIKLPNLKTGEYIVKGVTNYKNKELTTEVRINIK